MTLLILLLGILLVQLSFYAAIYPDCIKMRNLMKAYVVAADTWDSLYTVHSAFVTTILFNNTVRMHGKNNSRTVYE